MTKHTLALALALFAPAVAPLHAAEGELKDDLAKLQGKWRGTLTTGDGASIWTLDVKGSKAKVNVKSEAGDEVFKGEVEFKLERHGKFKAYTYFNLEIQSGDNAGEKRLTGGETRSSLYRFEEDDTWITVSGFREGDSEKPRLIKWERVK
jgi:hypothetical protein